ncbi:oligopeptide/dipeptide ABC transporter ATP-binding protein [Microbacterium ulmi]|uniref:ABC transporter ATP-binding protein n=1 Tax=Microbacterium ulmi TaxID=179095 RepID=A0A7Y2M2B6_9MICO|nr:oligopeptide/dipeptide ABC transporter ATP-binding protein [Microbacterium ulmi]NNH04714.1 ABC transporter ATP-binding protein [Microbacterium ulmi]
MDAETVVEVRDLTVVYPGRSGPLPALNGVSISLPQGRSLGVVGESGSGKSTLALAILGLLPSNAMTTGSIRVVDTDIVASSRQDVDRLRGTTMALVYQDALASLNPVRTVGAQILEVVRRHRSDLTRPEARTHAIEAMRRVGISDAAARMRQYPQEFSGGMRQRVAIAMALVGRPRLLIADEPTTALDVTVRTQTLAVLERMREELGMSVIHVSHDLEVIRDVSDDVAVMYHGRIVEYGPASEVLSEPRHPYTAALIDSVPTIATPRISFIPGTPPGAGDVLPGCPFEPRCAIGNGREECRTARPPLVGAAADDEHRVACHFPLQVEPRVTTPV